VHINKKNFQVEEEGGGGGSSEEVEEERIIGDVNSHISFTIETKDKSNFLHLPYKECSVMRDW
jgi:hypothetical protein